MPDFLARIQGNLLTPHGRPYGRLLFFQFHAPAEAARAWLQQAAACVTSALRQFQDAREKATNPNRPFVNLALSREGIDFLRCQQPGGDTPGGEAFAEGMWSRRDRLGDVVPGSRPITPLEWELSCFNRRPSEVHGLWLLARQEDVGDSSLATLTAEILELTRAVGVVVHEESGAIPRLGDKVFEPFGFRDGISMPTFFAPAGSSGALVNLPLEKVLIKSDRADAGGSFLVFRKLRQDVAGFREFERTLAKYLMDDTDPGRLLVGRYRDGTPLVPLRPGAASGDQNDFDFTGDPDARRCPFHAHIRKANARTRPAGPAQPGDHDVAAQFVRRSLVYGLGPAWQPNYPPPDDVGLLFMAYMAELTEQFEQMQAEWFTDPEFPDERAGLPDALILGGGYHGRDWQWETALRGVREKFRRFVHPLGGAYLFVPPLSWLEEPPVVA